ncbi:MAG: phenylalanine--tRNA ligase subunit alpha [Chlamydiae bacterium]|nr:phenylalanine--tRNA ligase subunit alpha [Chlamydiota bacterium]
MEEKVSSLRKDFQRDLKKIENTTNLENLKIKYLGKKGALQKLVLELKDLTPDLRPQAGKIINDLKQEISHVCEQFAESLEEIELAKQIEEEKIDLSLPGRQHYIGKEHPLKLMLSEVIDVLISMGFSVQYGPDVDSDYYNFEGLNYPLDHPARDMQDTFYISDQFLLRSQTTNVQLHIMETHKPPIRVISPGTVYRNENISSRSHVFFHQVEGIYIDEDVTFGDLFATMNEFWKKLFKMQVTARFRPSFFPFVEPGLEVDIKCTSCEGSGCRLCKQTGWLEVAGAGMIHPEVLKNGGIDPHHYSGYAWGLGIERLAMLRYGVKDIRMFSENDLRFLSQF